MYEKDILNDCLLELPTLGSFQLWSHKKVTDPLHSREVYQTIQRPSSYKPYREKASSVVGWRKAS